MLKIINSVKKAYKSFTDRVENWLDDSATRFAKDALRDIKAEKSNPFKTKVNYEKKI